MPDQPKKKPQVYLGQLLVDRVDFVDRGANPGAHIPLWKSVNPPSQMLMTGHKFMPAKNDSAVCSACGKGTEYPAHRAAASKGDQPMPTKPTDEQKSLVRRALERLLGKSAAEAIDLDPLLETPEATAPPAAPASTDGGGAGDGAGTPPSPDPAGDPAGTGVDNPPAAEEGKEEPPVADKPETPVEQKETPSSPDIAKALESLPAEVRKHIESVQAQAQDALAKAEAAQKRADEEYEKRVSREYLEEARTFKALPGDVDTIAKALRAIDEQVSDEETRKALRQTLSDSNARLMESRAFQSVGKSVGDSASAEARLDAMANDLLAKGEFKTFSEAYDHVLTTPAGRDLYAKAEDDKTEGVR